VLSERGPGGGHGIDGIGLALPAAGLAVGPVDLDHRHALGVQVAGQAGPVGASALDPDQDHRAEGTQPGQQGGIPGGGGGELLGAQHPPGAVECGGGAGGATRGR